MNTPTLPELPKPDHWIEDEARRHGAHICYFNEQNVSKYGREGLWIMGYSADQMRAYALAALSSALPQADEPLALAIRFHETYERLAPRFGYETRPDTKVFDPDSKNGRLMVAVCAALLKPDSGHQAEHVNQAVPNVR